MFLFLVRIHLRSTAYVQLSFYIYLPTNKLHYYIPILSNSRLQAKHNLTIFYLCPGLTADARRLVRYMRTECLNYKYAQDVPLPLSRLMTMIGNKMQMSTQGYDRRPYGVGLLVVGYDTQGPHLYQTCPSANYYDCKGMAIGARSQAARTYLEKNLDKLYDSTINELVAHALRALRDTLPAEMELTNKVISLNILFSLKPELELN